MRGLPPLRTVRADLPHTALQSVVLPHRGLTERDTGVSQLESPYAAKNRFVLRTLL